MVMEQDNRLRGQHHAYPPAQPGPMGMRPPQAWPPAMQQGWGMPPQPYPPGNGQAFWVPMPVMQPGMPFGGPMHMPMHVPGVMFHPPPQGFLQPGFQPPLGMPAMRPGGQVAPYFAAHSMQQLQRGPLPMLRRGPQSAPNHSQQVPARPAPPRPPAAPAPPGALQQPAPAAARGPSAGTRSAAAKAAGSPARPGSAAAAAEQVAAGSKAKVPKTATATDAPAEDAMEVDDLSSESDADWLIGLNISMNELELSDIGSSGWADLVDGILQQVVDRIKDNGASMAAFRATCSSWRKAADATLESLTPKAMSPRELLRLFPRLKVLQLVSCRNVRNRDLFQLANTPISPKGVEPPQFLALTSLVLGDDQNKPWVTNRGLESIGTMRHLRFLALHDCNSVTNKGIEALSDLVTLDCLSLRGCRKLTNQCTATIKLLTRITKLNLYGCKRLSDAGIEALEALPLVALSMGHTRIRDEGLKSIAKLRGLTELHFVREDIRFEGLKHLSTLTKLHRLSIRDLRITNQQLEGLLTLIPSLRDLSLYRNADINGVIFVNNINLFDNMTALDLRETNMTDAGLSACTSLLGLRVLKVRPPAPLLASNHNMELVEVSQLTQLTSLAVPLPKLRTNVLQSIGRLTGLRELDLSRGHCGFNYALQDDMLLDASVYGEIAKLTGLTSLDLSRRQVVPPKPEKETDKRLQPLAALQGPSGPRQVAEMMRQLRRLGRINLVSTNTSESNINRLERMFPTVDVVGSKAGTEASSDLANWGVLGTLSAL